MAFTLSVGPLSKNPLRFYRYRQGVTQKQLAQAAGVSESMICQIERRDVVPSLKVAYTLSQVTGIALDQLIRFCLRLDDPPKAP
jgi:transcriptional regulator with XRE-family HTH domain